MRQKRTETQRSYCCFEHWLQIVCRRRNFTPGSCVIPQVQQGGNVGAMHSVRVPAWSIGTKPKKATLIILLISSLRGKSGGRSRGYALGGASPWKGGCELVRPLGGAPQGRRKIATPVAIRRLRLAFCALFEGGRAGRGRRGGGRVARPMGFPCADLWGFYPSDLWGFPVPADGVSLPPADGGSMRWPMAFPCAGDGVSLRRPMAFPSWVAPRPGRPGAAAPRSPSSARLRRTEPSARRRCTCARPRAPGRAGWPRRCARRR